MAASRPPSSRRTVLRPVAEQTMVITGASSGIGLATARMAAREGARLVLASRNAEALEALARELSFTDVEIVVADVGIEEDVRRIAARAVERFGGFDTWVNDAGVSIYGPSLMVSTEDHKRLFDTNYWGVVYGSLTAAEHLRGRGGALINVGSVLSDWAAPLQGAYSASKHAVKGFTDALRIELLHDDIPISVTLIKPSAIDTPYPEHARNYLAREPALPPPIYAPELVAEAILHAAAHPVRELVIGAGGWAVGVGQRLFPALADRIMSMTMWKMQMRDEPRAVRRGAALYEPQKDGATGGKSDGVIRTSPFTQMQMQPVKAVLAAFLAGAAITRLIR